MTEVVVTGAAGFIGSHICRILSEQGESVIGCDPMTDNDDRWKNVRNVPIEWATHEDLRDMQWSRLIMCGWEADTRAPLRIFCRQLSYGNDLLRMAVKRRAHVVFVSSAAVYGDNCKGTPEGAGDVPEPMNAYAWSKLQTEFFVQKLKRQGCRMVIVRPFNVYGPNEYHKQGMASMALILHHRMLQGLPIELFRSNTPAIEHGHQKRDFVYVEDVADAICWLSEMGHEGARDGVFDLGTGEARTFLELATLCGELGDYQGKIGFKDMPRDLVAQYQNYTKAYVAPLMQAGFPGSFRPLAEGLRTYYEDYLLRGCAYA